MEKVAIVILNWNGSKMLKKYLPSVLQYSREEATVYVADNASTDDSIEMLRERFPEVKLILLEKNWGFAEGYNQSLNSDIEVTHHWLTPMIEYLDNYQDVAACQPKLLSIFDRDRFEYAGASGGMIDRFGYPFCRGRIFETVEADNGQYDNTADIFWATGAALMIRAKDYWKVGGLDARFFAHNEEIDLCWRLRIMGRRIVCLPDSQVYHVGGGTLPKSNPMKTYLNFRNNLTMLYKCLPQSDLGAVMRVRWVLDYVAAVQTLLKGNVGDFKAIFRARRDFKKWKKDFAADREQIQAGRVATTMAEYVPFMLLWQYFARGRKTFAKLQ